MGDACVSRGRKSRNRKGTLKWWQLSLLGVASTIGTGYFLGSALGIRVGGPAFLISIVIAAFATYLVFDMLARMTADDPQPGSFRTYAKQAYGRWAGFSTGWMYWCAEVLIMGSQMTALSIFSRFWFPDIPMWIFACGYAVLGLFVIWIGNKGFDRLENVLAVLKIAAIVMFLVIAAAACFGWLRGGARPQLPASWGDFFAAGGRGLWASLIFAFYAFGGIEVMGVMAIRLKNPKEAPKSGKIMILLLSIVYILSIGLAVMMVASLYAVTTMLVTLSEDQDAPKVFAKKKTKRKTPVFALALTAAGLALSIILSLLIPGKIYEYLTTAAGLMLLYNWFFILVTAGKIIRLTVWGHIKRFAGMLMIAAGVSGTAFHPTSRPGLWISFGFIVVIGIVVLFMQRVWKKSAQASKKAGKPKLRPKPAR